MREKELRELASQAATDAGFLEQARRGPKGTLAGFGYDLALEELRLVEDLRRRTAATSNSPVCWPMASEVGPAPRQPDLPPRGSMVRVRVDLHDPEVKGGGGA